MAIFLKLLIPQGTTPSAAPIPGESTDPLHPNTIDIDSMAWGVQSSTVINGSVPVPTQATANKVLFTAPSSRASARLFQAVMQGSLYNGITLFAVDDSGTAVLDSYKLRFDAAIFSKFEQSAASGDIKLVDNFELQWGKILVSYRQPKPDGTFFPFANLGWDRITYRPMNV